MTTTPPQRWIVPTDLAEATAAQREMAEQVVLEDAAGQSFATIAGMDVSNTPFDSLEMIYGAVVAMEQSSLTIVEDVGAAEKQEFPYIPGFLGFREVPILVKAFQRLAVRPHVLMVDGHGISHPRGLGVASHLGVVLDMPSVGVAKSVLVGRPAFPLGEDAGSTAPLVWQGREIGVLLRSKKRCTPLVISPGHKMTLATALALVQSCLRRYRLPEPTRQAHLFANAYRKNFQKI